MPIRRRRRSPASATFSGSRAASRSEAAKAFAVTLGGDVPHEITGTLDLALAAAARDAAEDSTAAEPVVLLSPACASFDQYRNFEVRGDAFRDLVRALPGIVTKR